ncbi:MAG TPA: paraquat-inducible protein A [Candidatus Binatia bacterium]|nr:paraquat-inducible protein A [Candidatus Binatia bacterium]
MLTGGDGSRPVPYARPLGDRAIVACPHCDLLQRLPELAVGVAARCPRCDWELRRRRADPLERTLALTLAAAVSYVIANTSPMLGLTVAGRVASTTVLGGVERLWDDGQNVVAVLVLFTAIIAPALQIAVMMAMLVGAHRPRPAAWVGTLLRHHPTTRVWSMIEVMMIGVLVALIKIAELATVIPGVALFALGALVFLLPAMQSCFDPHDVWDRVEWVSDRKRVAAEPHAAAGARP